MGKIVFIADPEEFSFAAAATSMETLSQNWLTHYNILPTSADNKELLSAARSSALVVVLPSAHPHRFPNELKHKAILDEIFRKRVPCVILFETQNEKKRLSGLFRENKYTFFSPPDFIHDKVITEFLSYEAFTYWERRRSMIEEFARSGEVVSLYSGNKAKPYLSRLSNNPSGGIIAHIFSKLLTFQT